MDTDVQASADRARAAVPEAGTSNRWCAAAAGFAQFSAGPVLSTLSELAVLEVEGPDAVAFLHSQCTADISAMLPTSFAPGGFCTAKGRLLAIFQAWRWSGGLRLLVPKGIATDLVRRLSMFVLRSKARVTDVSASWLAIGVCGPGSAAALAGAGIDVPDGPWQCRELDGEQRIARLPGGALCPERLLLLVQWQQSDAWRRRLSSLAEAEAGIWWWSQIDAAIPAVFAETRELFVPQTVNLELLGGVSFRKGCYPGQEIVARSQYLGKLRRRMGLAHAAAIGPDPDIFDDSGGAPAGRIVMAACAPGGGWDLLFECPTELLARGGLRAGSADAPALVPRELPYAIHDPTR